MFSLCAAHSRCRPLAQGIVETERFAFGPDKDHNTCLHFAAQRGNLPVVKWLVKLGMPVVGKNLYKKTALDIATRHNHQECVALLKDLTTTELKLRQASVGCCWWHSDAVRGPSCVLASGR